MWREAALQEGQASPVLGGGGVWGEEDVLDNTRVPLFHCSLPRMLILRVEREILGKPQPRQRSGPTQLWPSKPSFPCHTVLGLASGLGSP